MTYKHTQIGTAMLIIMGATFALLLFATQSKPDESFWPAFILIAIVAALFSSLTIKVDAKQIKWFFGPLFWCKSLDLNEVESVTKIETKWYYGLGIRLVTTGWLYNVSGLTAVEIKLKNGTTVSLGTNDPDNLINVIEHRS